ncbi:MAG: hypothetical protein IAE77_00400 [Prosthecobacter sp.]|jgi:hypothetical protein|uniref:hypothetical protein n=1 Tax=Prosthecobacter sp. TaxID=1965333 RepID=UPI0019E7D161|nr:hypothetical protein [Prosthecobacter sp.]MBE2281899.1 hypothetical protein [Prosthecobacter sp.]
MKYLVRTSGNGTEGPFTTEELCDKYSRGEIDENSDVAHYIGAGLSKSFKAISSDPDLLERLRLARTRFINQCANAAALEHQELVKTLSKAISILDHHLAKDSDWVDIQPTERKFLEHIFASIVSTNLDDWDDLYRAIYKRYVQFPGRERYLNLLSACRNSELSKSPVSDSRNQLHMAATLLLSTQLRGVDQSLRQIHNELSDDDTDSHDE